MASRVLTTSEVVDRDLWIYGMHKAGLMSKRAFIKWVWYIRCARDPFFKDDHKFEEWSANYLARELPAMVKSRRTE